MILLLIIIFIIINYVINNQDSIKENFGSDFFHHSFLSGLGKEMRNKELQKIYDFYGLKKENFENKDEKNFNENVLSDIPKNELKIDFELEDLKYDEQKHILEEEKEQKLADYLEVEKYDSGSGDLNELKKVFEENQKKDFNETMKSLKSRGGNV